MTCTPYNNITANNSHGKLTVDSLNQALIQYQDIEKYQTTPSIQFDQVQLREATVLLNSSIQILDDKGILTNYQYTDLATRIENSPITIDEVALFIVENNIEFSQFVINNTVLDGECQNVYVGNSSNLSIPSNQFVYQLNNFYQSSFSANIMGSVCSILADTFSAVIGIFKTIGDLINGDTSSLTAMMNLATQLIQSVMNYGKQLLSNIGNTITGLENFNAFSFFASKYQAIQSLFDGSTQSSITSMVESIISNMAGQFKNLDGNTLPLILFKICQIATSIESFIMNPVNMLNQQVNMFQNKNIPLQTYSNLATGYAIAAGAVRLDRSAVIQGRKQVSNSINAQANYFGGVNPAKYITIPADDFEKSLVVNLTENGNQFVEFSDNVKNMEKIRPSSIAANNIPGAGWRKVSPDAYIKIFRVAERLGVRLLINSAYRNENYNASVGGKSRSCHLTGQALDISMNGVNPNEFIKTASQEGFLGIGTYPTFIHTDIGSRRCWGSLYNQALQLHIQDRFRRG